MSVTAEQELTIAKGLAAKITEASDVSGYVFPCPIFFVDKADFWATVNALTNRRNIEQTVAAYVIVSLLKRDDDLTEGCLDNPLVNLTYNFQLFRQYGYTRADESSSPDDFLKKNLQSYLDFKKALLEIWEEFLGIQDLPDMPDGVTAQTNALTQDEYIQENAPSGYFMKDEIKGFVVNLQCVVNVVIEEES